MRKAAVSRLGKLAVLFDPNSGRRLRSWTLEIVTDQDSVQAQMRSDVLSHNILRGWDLAVYMGLWDEFWLVFLQYFIVFPVIDAGVFFGCCFFFWKSRV